MDTRGQGSGEVDITALETSLIGTFQFVVRKDMHLKWPRAETADSLHRHGHRRRSHGGDEDRRSRSHRFPHDRKDLSREDAYMLSSVAVDFDVTQVVDGTKGVHGMIPKSIFKK